MLCRNLWLSRKETRPVEVGKRRGYIFKHLRMNRFNSIPLPHSEEEKEVKGLHLQALEDEQV